MKISRAHVMFLHHFTQPRFAHAGACREVLNNYIRWLGNSRVFPSLNHVDTSEP